MSGCAAAASAVEDGHVLVQIEGSLLGLLLNSRDVVEQTIIGAACFHWDKLLRINKVFLSRPAEGACLLQRKLGEALGQRGNWDVVGGGGLLHVHCWWQGLFLFANYERTWLIG